MIVVVVALEHGGEVLDGRLSGNSVSRTPTATGWSCSDRGCPGYVLKPEFAHQLLSQLPNPGTYLPELALIVRLQSFTKLAIKVSNTTGL